MPKGVFTWSQQVLAERGFYLVSASTCRKGFFLPSASTCPHDVSKYSAPCELQASCSPTGWPGISGISSKYREVLESLVKIAQLSPNRTQPRPDPSWGLIGPNFAQTQAAAAGKLGHKIAQLSQDPTKPILHKTPQVSYIFGNSSQYPALLR